MAEGLFVRCFYCEEPCDPLSREVTQAAWGWEQGSHVRPSGKHGGSDITLRQKMDRWAHNECIQLQKSGINPEQTTMVGEEVSR